MVATIKHLAAAVANSCCYSKKTACMCGYFPYVTQIRLFIRTLNHSWFRYGIAWYHIKYRAQINKYARVSVIRYVQIR